MPNALQIAQVRQTQFSAGLLSTVVDENPLFSAFDFRTVNGLSFLSLALVRRPDPAGFVPLGEGFESSEAAFELRKFDCYRLGGLVKTEVDSENLWNQENSLLRWEWFDIQTEEKFKESIFNLEKQMILGLVNDANGFPGAKDLTPFQSANVITMAENGAKYKYARAVLNAGGTTSDTGSSVYAFRFGEKECQGIIGNGASSAEFLQIDEPTEQFLAPKASEPTKLSLHKAAQMRGYVGMTCTGSNELVEGQLLPTQYGIRRITNLTAEAGKSLSDLHMTKVSRMFGTGKSPSLYAMSERSGEQLAASRAPVATHFNMGGGDAAAQQANQYPDPPMTWGRLNTPIVYVSPDVIVDTDVIEA